MILAPGAGISVDNAPVQAFADGTLHRLEIGLALRREIAMLGQVSNNQVAARVLTWGCDVCLVVPRRFASMASFPSAARESMKRGFPVFLRDTGGDVVVQGPGVINVSVVFSLPLGLRGSIGEAYQILCKPLLDYLRARKVAAAYGTVPGAMCDGSFNVIVDGRKLAGTAQRWKQKVGGPSSLAVLAHLALSVDTDHTAAAEAVNAFYADVGIGREVCADRHVNLVELLSQGMHSQPDVIVTELVRYYGTEFG